MSYKLFIDDERMPIGENWVIVRSYDDAMKTILEKGCPDFISFDHDLGVDGSGLYDLFAKTGYDIAKDFADLILDNKIKYNQNFTFYVHSQNPVGKKSIEIFLFNFMREMNKEGDSGI